MLVAIPAACRLASTGCDQEQVRSDQRHTIVTDASEPDDPQQAPPDIDLRRLLGRISPANDASFSRVERPHANREGLYLLDEVYDAFVAMRNAAGKDGVSLVIVSATRDFDAQKKIWQRKWTGARLVEGRNLAKTVPDPIERARIILRYSSMPGTSRHHWGTDIDINSVENAYFASAKGREVYAWLNAHAHEFGFCQTYTPKGNDRPYGYEEEPWHWSYCPIASRYLRQYTEKVTYDHITGFPGAHTAAQLDVIKHYVLGINPACRRP
jgi:LAS superfamily LD-carboxypeptidase LdcB